MKMTISRIDVGVLVGCAVISVLGFILLYCSPAWTFMRSYESLAIGQSRAEVVEVFGKDPDYACTFGDYEILYYFRSTLLSRECVFSDTEGKVMVKEVGGEAVPLTPEDMPKTVESWKAIPYVYAAGQLLIAPDGRLVAYTHIDEEEHVHTTVGDIRGGRLTDLDESFFQEP